MIAFRKEVEMKLKVDENIASMLKCINLESHEEVDEYFTTREILEKRIFLRFRKKKGKVMLELKVLTFGGKNTDIYESDEIETELTQEQYESVKKIFSILFPISFQVKKIRGRGSLKGCELCYDKVEGLGDFLEIEGPKEKILEICKDFNIDIEKQRDREEGYALMTAKKMGFI